jgi:uncharacterized membrane protein YccC
MRSGHDYLREVHKFTTSQYWNTGVRITVGVMIPTLVLSQQGWLTMGIPFLWGSLFVSGTDTPGPIHHRRNGMLAAIIMNSLVVLVTSLCREYAILLFAEIILLSFFLSLIGIYGARAGAVGTLALVIMLLYLVPLNNQENPLQDAVLMAGGGLWYTAFSLLLYRLRPYRLAEQAIGENLIDIADYIRSRASFFREGADLKEVFNRVMQEQVTVLKNLDQTKELLFKTRQFVADASPKSRSIMMVFFDSIDLFEQALYSYQDYEQLHEKIDDKSLLNNFYGVVLQLAAALEHIGIIIQSGGVVKKDPDLTKAIDQLESAWRMYAFKHPGGAEIEIEALQKTLQNIKNIANRMHRLAMYTRLEFDHKESLVPAVEASKQAIGQPIRIGMLWENMTLQSNQFRFAVRLTIAMVVGYLVSIFFSLNHTSWVLLTIVTILKPVYSVTRRRNIQRVAGTITGAFIAILILLFIKSNTVLLIILFVAMLLGYSLLRINYFGFVIFLTIYIIMTFHFLHPVESKSLIEDRLIDTVIGSVIAAVAARFILPVWGRSETLSLMKTMLKANLAYLQEVWNHREKIKQVNPKLNAARQEAIVALTNLSDNFQQMLSEPLQSAQSIHVHQFVIANHMLTGYISALATEISKDHIHHDPVSENAMLNILNELSGAVITLDQSIVESKDQHPPVIFNQTMNQLSIILTLVRDIRLITGRIHLSS